MDQADLDLLRSGGLQRRNTDTDGVRIDVLLPRSLVATIEEAADLEARSPARTVPHANLDPVDPDDIYTHGTETHNGRLPPNAPPVPEANQGTKQVSVLIPLPTEIP
jgi:hypothetical protein